mmetsp:Transcript_22768/g.69646  ORF Transcript_22768/g.69646 Transcript_22768/m.69646 type:complete len:200 (+) Transcript_22768:541-1140(+)
MRTKMALNRRGGAMPKFQRAGSGMRNAARPCVCVDALPSARSSKAACHLLEPLQKVDGLTSHEPIHDPRRDHSAHVDLLGKGEVGLARRAGHGSYQKHAAQDFGAHDAADRRHIRVFHCFLEEGGCAASEAPARDERDRIARAHAGKRCTHLAIGHLGACVDPLDVPSRLVQGIVAPYQLSVRRFKEEEKRGRWRREER